MRSLNWKLELVLRRALILDDDPNGASALCELLRQSGWDAQWCDDGEAMMLLAAGFRPQLLVLDLDMPRITGLEVARRLRAQPWAQQAVIVAFSGGRGDKMPSEVMEAGFDHFCPKPYRPEYLELWGAPRSGSG